MLVVSSDAGKSVFGRGFSRRSSLDGRISSEPPMRVSPSFGEVVAESVDEENDLVYLDWLTSSSIAYKVSGENRASYGIEDALKSKNLLILHRKHELIHVPDGISTLLSEMSLDPHNYKASIVGYYRYWSEARGQTAYCPRVAGMKFNPYMRINKVYASISRTIRNLDGLIELCNLKSPYMLDMVLTIPSELSSALYSLEDGGDKIVWDAYKAFLKDLDKFFAPAGKPGSWRLGVSANLHRWKSDLPVGVPHYHFHSLFPNFIYDRAGARFRRFQPFLSENQLRVIRSIWLVRIQELGDAVDVPTDDYTADNINIHFSYISMSRPGEKPDSAVVSDGGNELRQKKDAVRLHAKKRRDRSVFVHKLKYKARPFFSDFVEWFTDNSTFAVNTDKDALKRMILLTENDRTHTFGFVRCIAGCIEDVNARSNGDKAGKIAREKYKKATGTSHVLDYEQKLIQKSIQDPEGSGELVFEGSIDLSDLPPCPIIVYSRSGRTVIPPPEVKSKEG